MRLAGRAALVAVLLILPFAARAGASADPWDTSVQATSGKTPGIGVRDQGQGISPAKPTKPKYSKCIKLPVAIGTMILGGGYKPFDQGTYTDEQKATAKWWMYCDRADGTGSEGFLTYPPRPDAGALVAQAKQSLVLPTPEVQTSPPRGGTQLVGVPVWFWVTNAKPAATTASVPGLSATLTATPGETHVKIRGGTGRAAVENTSFDCPGAGTPYAPGKANAKGGSDCSHAFDWNATFTIDVTVDWTLTWTATNGQAGTLPLVPRTTTFTLRIEQAQAVTD